MWELTFRARALTVAIRMEINRDVHPPRQKAKEKKQQVCPKPVGCKGRIGIAALGKAFDLFSI